VNVAVPPSAVLKVSLVRRTRAGMIANPR
jgi:hypothetical protein